VRYNSTAALLFAGCLAATTVLTACEVRPPTAEDEADGTAADNDAAANDIGKTTDAGPTDAGGVQDVGGEDCPGGPFCPCSENAECDSAICIETPEGKKCAKKCIDACPGAYVCAQVTGSGDVSQICVPRYGRLCDPCSESKTCEGLGLIGAFCVDYGFGGAFCGLKCNADKDCGAGYECVEATSIEGKKAKQCVRKKDGSEPAGELYGTCECSKQATLQSLKTTCFFVTKDDKGNVAGKCSGERLCETAGLSKCKAPAPKPETCNDVDDDCDGKTDEETCDDKNACTADSCDGKKADPKTGKDGCVHKELNSECDADGTVCTKGDTCVGGVCKVGKKVDCDDGNACTKDACDDKTGCSNKFNDGGACDDGNPCSEGAVCAAGKCKSGTLKKCDSGNACVDGKCNFKTGKCVFDEVGDKTVCDDKNACTVLTVCTKGLCKGKPKDCDDGNKCTDEVCDKKKGCQVQNNVKACDDGDACTKDDTCLGGKCKVNKVNCDDNNACTKDSCDSKATGSGTGGKGACKNVAMTGGCDADGNACTVGDVCEKGVCKVGKKKSCDDGSICTIDTCDAASGVCKFNKTKTEGLSCNADSSVCTVGDTCKNGQCESGKKKVCDDSNKCTIDACDPKAGCKNINSDGPCDADGDACTAGDKCDSGKCKAGAPKKCNDNSPCTKDSCDKLTGKCVYDGSNFEGQPCDADGSICTVGDTCKKGSCEPGKKKNCDDQDPCTDDECNPKKGCNNTHNSGPCNADDNPCTKGDKCVDGQCKVGQKTDCNDKNPCTVDSCSVAKKGCVYDGKAKNGQVCDADGSVCSEVDKCVDGQCKAGTLKKCVDGNTCTDDACDKKKGCTYTNNTDPCSDGKTCTIGDRCKTAPNGVGKCYPGKAKGCNDGNVCTQDQCDDSTGKCTYIGKAQDGELCDKDGSFCTVKDSCKDGECKVGKLQNCDDGNDCTNDACSPKAGCQNTVSDGACTDGSKCTTNDKCSKGKCVTQPVVCDDTNPCTTDTCDPKVGCINKVDRHLKKCGDYKICLQKTCTKAVCGDLTVHAAVEKCDKGNLNANDCNTVLGNDSWGILKCGNDCVTWDTKKCHDLSWMERSDDCKGFKASSIHKGVRWAISKSALWDKTKKYECPKGYRWMTTAEGKKMFTGSPKGGETYWNECGWYGLTYKGVERKLLRFSDSAKTNAYKHMAFNEGATLLYDKTASFFAGIVCIKE